MKKLIEDASVVFKQTYGEEYELMKSRHKGLILGSKYSEAFVNFYADTNSDVLIIDCGELDLSEEEPLKVGDYAKFVKVDVGTGCGGENYVEIGEVVKLIGTGQLFDFRFKAVSSGKTSLTNATNLIRATDEEIADAKEKLAAAKAQAEAKREADRWEKIGRKPGEFKDGDIVRVDDPCGSRLKSGELVEVKHDSDDSISVRVTKVGWAVTVSELITPVESRFDLAQDDAK